jgi:hypothetical protein
VVLTRRGLPRLSELLPGVAEPGAAGDDLDAWLDERDFLAPVMARAAQNTRLAAASDLCRFLRFLHECRGGRSWRDAGEDDHVAYLYWRRFDPAGPRVAASTWNRELALVSGFFGWAVRQRLVAASPVALRAGRDHQRWRAGGPAEVPAARARVEWLTPGQYRRWRDCGLRGYQADGLPDGGFRFRRRWASRNALFADVMVRTGLRLAEQASLTVLEVPRGLAGQGYERFWLPGAVAKNESALWVYLPAALARKTAEYIAADRAAVIAAARARGAYDALGGTLVIEDPGLGLPRGRPPARVRQLRQGDDRPPADQARGPDLWPLRRAFTPGNVRPLRPGPDAHRGQTTRGRHLPSLLPGGSPGHRGVQ